jgi:molybdopterin/thiamine biosynthesis adenylyltransferase
MMSLDSETVSNQSTLEAKQQSKLILRSALQKANEAVQCDSTNNVMGAINAYNEAISLLDCVLATVEKENDRHRLQEIVRSMEENERIKKKKKK